MKIDYDRAKRLATLQHRGLDMEDADQVFEGLHITFEDLRFDYGERRFLTFGMLQDRMVLLAWTRRDDAVRIISMRKANEREQGRYRHRLG